MQTLTLTFNQPLNTSLQVGDIIYYSSLQTVANSGFSTSSSNNTVKLGIVNSISNPLGIEQDIIYDSIDPTLVLSSTPVPITITVVYDDSPIAGIVPPTQGDYISFEKDKKVNSSSLIGYYADVRFENYSPDDARLFSVGSEVSESSK